eukprot:194391-Prymnesium_polylepis.1
MYWSTIPSLKSSRTVTVGSKGVFYFEYSHNVYAMESEAKYDSCDFSGAIDLGTTGTAQIITSSGFFVTYWAYVAVLRSTGTLYLSCNTGNNCANGQKVIATIVEAFPPSPPALPPKPPASPSPPGSPPASLPYQVDGRRKK